MIKSDMVGEGFCKMEHRGLAEPIPARFEPADMGMRWLGFEATRLNAQQSLKRVASAFEVVMVILSGRCEVRVGESLFSALGRRQRVFDGPATAVYIPVGTDYEISARTDLEIAECRAKAEQRFEPFVVQPEEISTAERGQDGFRRVVHDVVTSQGEGRVDRIVVGETFNAAGQWSSFPPHRHDRDNPPHEVDMEEIYYYKFQPSQGFGAQFLYDKESGAGQAYMVKDSDSFAIAGGFHPVVGAPGYQFYYLWFMAGSRGRTLVPFNDPDHTWTLG